MSAIATPAPLRVGLISDTHRLLRREALAFLRGSDHIIHAGDICDPRILEELAALAPLTAVRGNNDHGPWAESLPEVVDLGLGGINIRIIHDLADLVRVARVAAPGDMTIRVVVSGHSHKPAIQERDGILYVNPGSAGPRRFKLPIAVGELRIRGRSVSARIVQL